MLLKTPLSQTISIETFSQSNNSGEDDKDKELKADHNCVQSEAVLFNEK